MFRALSIDVIDPLNRTGKITVPNQHLEETRGLLEHRRSDASRPTKDLSLCLLYQKGRCNAGARCHQIHADVQYITKLRAQATAGSACCALHGDFSSSGFLSSECVVALTDASRQAPTIVPISYFARTSALDTYMRGTTPGAPIRVPQSKVCRLHGEGRCKFGRDCKNVHVCQKGVVAAMPPRAKPQPESNLEFSQRGILDRSTASSTSVCGASTPARSVSLASSVADSPEAPRSLDVSELAHLSFAKSVGPLFSPTLFSAQGFESAISLVCEDLAGLQCSPLASP